MALTKSPGAWTYNDLLALPDDGTRYEIIDGELYEMPAPSWEHGIVVMNLILLLGPLVRSLGGTIATSPVDVFFPGADPVEPDILVMLPGSRAAGGGRGVQGPPDLLIEVLSPSTRTHDLVTKRSLYARGGVREYWIVDPQARTVEVLTLDGGRYRSALSVVTGEAVTSPVLGDAVFSLTEVFAGIDEETA
ncbi:MAG: Uma2 family endonuclease [Thermomicrobiales bacterium]